MCAIWASYFQWLLFLIISAIVRVGHQILPVNILLLLLFFLQVIADNISGLLFKNKRDRKVINVDPKV